MNASDGGVGQSAFGFANDIDGSGNGNALVLSLYLINSEEDIILQDGTGANNDVGSVEKRARLYQRLCQACAVANDILRSSSSHDKGDSNSNSKHHCPWSSGGDGPIFGIHCDTSSDDYFTAINEVDGDDIWQSQSPFTPSSKSKSSEEALNDALRQTRNNRVGVVNDDDDASDFRQPHLRAVCHYNNDINDMWRCISLAFRISSTLSSLSNNGTNLTCAIECWETSDGQILLIESAEYLPPWVDDDVLQGGVGGPKGCRNRCWLVDGRVCLIPPSISSENYLSKAKMMPLSDSVDTLLGRRDALHALMEAVNNCTKNSLEGLAMNKLVASDSVQSAIQDRINRTDYSIHRQRSRTKNNTLSQDKETNNTHREEEDDSTNNSHYHIAPAALPASVARFLFENPCLVPLLVDSFCAHAPTYLKEKSSQKKMDGDSDATAEDDDNKQVIGRNTQQNNESSSNNAQSAKSSSSFGTLFPYEQIVLLPITFTRTNYAELATGRGIVPSFPTPEAYRSVELNRFRRQLQQQSYGSFDSYNDDRFANNDDNNAKETRKRRRNPFHRAVDVGIRLCAGLDWIVSSERSAADLRKGALELEDSAISALGDVERRLRIYWTRIDAEASRGRLDKNEMSESSQSLPWIEQAWQAGPNGSGGPNHTECNKTMLQALEAMSKCPVYNPELSKPLLKEPCPYTRPGLSLQEWTKSGMKRALKWTREKYDESSFPVPKVWEVDDDGWMEVNSLEELEEEMRNLSSRKENRDVNAKNEEGGKKPRRTTRRSRRRLAQANKDGEDDAEQSDVDEDTDKQKEDVQSLNKVLGGFRSFVEGEGELEGAVTKRDSETAQTSKQQNLNESENNSNLEPEQIMSQEVKINPRRFLNILHAMLSSQHEGTGESESDLIATSDNAALGEEKEDLSSAIDHDVSKYFFDEDMDRDDESDGSEIGNDEGIYDGGPDDSQMQYGPGQDPWSLQNIMEAMDHELRTDTASDPSIKNLSVASEDNNNTGGTEGGDGDVAILANLLSSIDAQGDASGPVTNILREMGICPPRLPADEDDT